MITNKKIQNYYNFFLDQVRELELEQKQLVRTSIKQLVRKGGIVYEGKVAYVNDKRGHVVLKFKKGWSPRLKVLKTVFVVKKSAFKELGTNIQDWDIDFKSFYNNSGYHSFESDILPLYFLNKGDNTYDYVGCTGLSIEMYDFFKKAVDGGKDMTFLMFTPLPPTDYLKNIANFLDVYQDLPEQTIEPKIQYEDWRPEELSYDPTDENAIAKRIEGTLRNDDCCILQGPPGTGKSYTIAYIIAKYLEDNKSVCVTTMANKGLLELVQQPPLKPYLEAGRISKSNLTVEERSTAKGLKSPQQRFYTPKGEMFCSTNYVLSQIYNANNPSSESLPSYDLVIIEEASQAFLAAILAFKQLGKKCLIVGDPLQLPPIVSCSRNSNYKGWNINTQIEGLKTYALGTETKAFRIVTTFRLTEKSASLTKIFYNNRFSSVQKDKVSFKECQSKYFPEEGGTLYCYTDDYKNGVLSEKGASIIQAVLTMFKDNYPKRSLAIITPFKDSVGDLQSRFLTENSLENLVVETIDRIQGMTVDYTILYVPGRNPGFALDEKRFNVATSRSRTTTLIISDIPLEELLSVPATVIAYLRECEHIEVDKPGGKRREVKEIETILNGNDVKALYPGLERIVDMLQANDIAFSQEGDVDLVDENDVVIASAGLLLRDQKIAIDPVDASSEKCFRQYGYRTVTSDRFSIEMVKN